MDFRNSDDCNSDTFHILKFGSRGVIHSFADGKIEDTGPLTRKRMETIDAEVYDKVRRYIEMVNSKKRPKRLPDVTQIRDSSTRETLG